MAHLLALALAWAAVVVAAGGCIGVLVMPTVLDRLHYIGPVATVGAAALVAGAAIDLGVSRSAAKVGIVALVLAVGNAVVAHATAAAAHPERDGDTGGAGEMGAS